MLSLLGFILHFAWCHAANITYTFNLTDTYLAQAGFFKTVKTINGLSPGPVIEADENDWITVVVHNHLQESAAIHFHGILQRGTPWSDGVPGVTQYPIPSGEDYTYKFQALHQSGPFWYHSHYRGYLSDGLYGLIYIRPAPHQERPYLLITSNPDDIRLLTALEKAPLYLVADDIFKPPMDEVIQRMFTYGIDPLCIQSIIVNGKGRVVCHSQEAIDLLARQMTALPEPVYFDSMACARDPFLDYYQGTLLDHYALETPGYSPPCRETKSRLHMHYTNNKDWQYVVVLNAGGQYTKAFSIDDHLIYVVAIDGVFVTPRKVHSILIPVGSRYTICFRTEPFKHQNPQLPFAMHFAAAHTPQFIEAVAFLVYGTEDLFEEADFSASVNPSTYRNGEVFQRLDSRLTHRSLRSVWPQHLEPLDPQYVFQPGPNADVTFHFLLHMFDRVQFTMFRNRAQIDHAFETSRPLLHCWRDGDLQRSTSLPAILQPPIRLGQVVDLIVQNHKHINHPVHLHGHLVHVISFSHKEHFPYESVQDAIDDDYANLNLINPPCLDVVMIPVGGHAVLRFVADNPGIWLFHYHNIGHLLGGMGAVLQEAVDHIPQEL